MINVEISKKSEQKNHTPIDITFVVTTYNHRDLVLQALESIKYQIKHYKNDKIIQLIISDDGSTDETVNIVKKWLKINKSIFDEVCELYSEINRGTCKSVADAFRKIKGKSVYAMSGDDLLMNTNLIERLVELEPDEIILCPPLKIRNNMLIKNVNEYYGDLMRGFYKKKDIIFRSLFSCPIMNGSLIGRNFYNESSYVFAEKFILLEDRARYMNCFQNKKEFKLSYSNKPVLLYRYSDMQVTSRKGSSYSQILEDVISISEYAMQATRNPLLKLRIIMEREKLIHPEKYVRILKYFDMGFLEEIYFYKIKENRLKTRARALINYGVSRKIEEYVEEIRYNTAKYF